MTVLVTGGAGFIGANLVEALLARGEKVRVYDLKADQAIDLAGQGADLITGNILAREELVAAMEGCDRVFHLAALLDLWQRDRSIYHQNNVEGTRNVLESALEMGVSRVVHTSSATTVGEADGEIGTEQTVRRAYFLSEYERSKYLGEQVALELYQRGLPIVILNPTSVYGPRQTVNVTGAIIRFLEGRLPVTVNSRLNYVYVGDVVEGQLSAMERGKIGERYILGADNVPMVEFFSLAGEIAGIARRPRAVPGRLLRIIATLLATSARLSGGRPAIAPDEARTASHSFIMDTSKAQQELGLVWTPLRVGLERTVNWLHQESLVADAHV
ncbi:MAG: NAD-dependent epimerase/dehydratase family protein [Anaerolineae bacterium]|nr:NAD-dependent epimerase/dehydratase family protein [Anaerolineae bacterium]